ncbi:MAG: PTS sugar transporter subunit IIC [Propionicimonas sp.]|nr:PTS sugar transporter subunit IIC [Propionicimonas sp.]MEA5053036.1 PTS sugar transporter subunit IIC [Propionicimonas sp.]
MTEALLIGLIVAVVIALNMGVTRLFIDRPIIVCPFIGLLLGDFQTGLIIGATLELLFLGAVSVGNALPPNALVAGALACAFAMKMNASTEVALALAMPIGVIVTVLDNLKFSLVSIVSRMFDNFGEQGNTKAISATYWITGIILSPVFYGGIVVIAYAFGADAVQAGINMLPPFILEGMTVAAGLIPAVGIALLLKMVYNKKVVIFYLLGFILAAYLKLPILAVVLVGVVLILTKYDFSGFKSVANATNAKEEVAVDDDF